MSTDQEEQAVRGMGDLRLIRLWREFSRALEFGVSTGASTTNTARRLGYLEREMERRSIRHDDWTRPVLDPQGVWHQP